MSAPRAVPDGFDPRVRGLEIASPPAASLPGSVEELLDGSPVVPLRGRGGRPDVRRRDANGWRQISTAVASARALDVLTFQQAVMDAFAAVFDQLGPAGAVHPVRFWAFVPDIHAQLEPDLDRYMVFNAARFAAFSAWYGGRDAFPRARGEPASGARVSLFAPVRAHASLLREGDGGPAPRNGAPPDGRGHREHSG